MNGEGAEVHCYKTPFPETLGNVGDVLLKADGELRELSRDGHVLSRLNLPTFQLLVPHQTPISIQVFYTYRPFFKYYLILIERSLYIVKKVDENQLKLHKTVHNVRKVFIKDTENSGEPKLLIVSEPGQKPSSVDLYCYEEKDFGIRKLGSALVKVRSQIQGINALLDNSRRVLLDKKVFVSKLGGSILESPSRESGIPLIKILGNVPLKRDVERSCPVSCGKLWVREAFESWIVGIHLTNNEEMWVEEVELVAVSTDCWVERSSLWLRPAGRRGFVSASTSLPPKGQAFLLGVIPEPLVLTSKASLPFALAYIREGSQNSGGRRAQCFLGTLEVTMFVKSVSSRIDPAQDEIIDLLAILMKCSSTEIISPLSMTDENDLISSLEELGFNKFQEYLCLHDPGVPYILRGLVLQVMNLRDNLSLTIHYRRKQQLVWFLDLLKKKAIPWSGVRRDAVLTTGALLQEINSLEKVIRENFGMKGVIPSEKALIFLKRERNFEINFHNLR